MSRRRAMLAGVAVALVCGSAADGTAYGSGRESQVLLWSALGGKVRCGPTYHPPGMPEELLCIASSIPAPKPDTHPLYGEPVVFLKARGRPQRVRLNQGGLFEKEQLLGITSATQLRPGTSWNRPELGVTCAVEKRAVRCRNSDGHGFVIRQDAYRAF
jgi:hypothetical protein